MCKALIDNWRGSIAYLTEVEWFCLRTVKIELIKGKIK